MIAWGYQRSLESVQINFNSLIQLVNTVCRFDPEVEGGESLFLDSFHVAEEFRKQFPEDFDNLVRIPGTFQKIHFERYLPKILLLAESEYLVAILCWASSSLYRAFWPKHCHTVETSCVLWDWRGLPYEFAGSCLALLWKRQCNISQDSPIEESIFMLWSHLIILTFTGEDIDEYRWIHAFKVPLSIICNPPLLESRMFGTVSHQNIHIN